MSTLMLNSMIKYKESDTYFRIIWLDDDNEYCYLIELETTKLNIILTPISDLKLGLETKDIEIVEELQSSLTKAYFDNKENSLDHMNKAYEFVQKIASTSNEPYCFDKRYRRKLILSVLKGPNVKDPDEKDPDTEDPNAEGPDSKKPEISERTAYTYLRKYWQGGKIKASLYPKYHKCGNKGENISENQKKVGKKSKDHKDNKCGPGIIVNEDIKKQIEYSIEKVYNQKSKGSIMQAYHWMLGQYFSTEAYVDGELKRAINPPDQIPTYGQYKYQFYKLRDLDNSTRKRDGEKYFEMNSRALNSDSTYEVMGPGHKYQIDSTVADIYLVNSIDGMRVPERPIIYLAVDVFSRLIAGIHVCFERPSMEGAASLIYNCFEDKHEFCSKYGIEIDEFDWPSFGLPRVIFADRGETVGPIFEDTIRGLGIQVEQAPSYRGDSKGIVEQNFRILNNLTKRTLPGTIDKKFKERGDPDYRVNAKLTLAEYTKIIIEAVIHRNNTILPKYPLSSAMIKDNIKPIPSVMWKWGIENSIGTPIQFDKDRLIASLMKRDIAVVGSTGISFKHGIYTCEIARLEGWFSRARQTGSWKIEVLYDTRDNYKIFFFDDRTNKLVPCYLNERKTINNRYLESSNLADSNIYVGTSFYEIENYQESKQSSIYEETDYRNQKQLELNDRIKKVVDTANRRKGLESHELKNIRLKRKEGNQLKRSEQSLTSKIGEDSGFYGIQDSMSKGNNVNMKPNIMIAKIKKWEEED